MVADTGGSKIGITVVSSSTAVKCCDLQFYSLSNVFRQIKRIDGPRSPSSVSCCLKTRNIVSSNDIVFHTVSQQFVLFVKHLDSETWLYLTGVVWIFQNYCVFQYHNGLVRIHSKSINQRFSLGANTFVT